VDVRRELRPIASQLKHYTLAELLSEHSSAPSWPTLDNLDYDDIRDNRGLRALIPDSWHDYDCEDVSDYLAGSSVFAFQLDASTLKAQDRVAHDYKPSYEITGEARMVIGLLKCDHFVNGIDPYPGCKCCSERIKIRDPFRNLRFIYTPDEV